MAEPRPRLRYTLLPELKDMSPGNPVYGYSKCFGEQNNFYYHKSAVDQREKWLAMPLKDLPVDKVMANYGGYSLRLADYAARLDTPDWQILLRFKSEGMDMLLPDLQQLRIARRGRSSCAYCAEVAARRFDDAVKTAQTLFALSRHLGEHPTLIGDLVGLAVGYISLRPLEEMLGQPGCPNLYWALTDLPSPFIDLRKGMQGERPSLVKEFAPFDRDTPARRGGDRPRAEAARRTLTGHAPPGGAVRRPPPADGRIPARRGRTSQTPERPPPRACQGRRPRRRGEEARRSPWACPRRRPRLCPRSRSCFSTRRTLTRSAATTR